MGSTRGTQAWVGAHLHRAVSGFIPPKTQLSQGWRLVGNRGSQAGQVPSGRPQPRCVFSKASLKSGQASSGSPVCWESRMSPGQAASACGHTRQPPNLRRGPLSRLRGTQEGKAGRATGPFLCPLPPGQSSPGHVLTFGWPFTA